MSDLNLDTIRPRVRRRADQVGSTFRADADVNDYIQLAYRELYYYLVGRYEDYFTVSSTGGALVPSVAGNPLPADFFKLLSVSLRPAVTTGPYRPLTRTTLREALTRFDTSLTGTPTHYWLAGAEAATAVPTGKPWGIVFYHTPDAAYQITLVYVPAAGAVPGAVDATRTFNPYLTGAEDYVTCAAALKLLNDEQNPDTAAVTSDMERALARLEAALTPVDAAEPAQIVDREAGWPWRGYDGQDWWGP